MPSSASCKTKAACLKVSAQTPCVTASSGSPVLQKRTALAITGEGEGFPSQWLEIWAKPGSRILISGKGPLLKSWTVKSDIPQQKDQQRFMNYSRRHIDVYRELSVQDRILFEKIRQADKETRPALKKSLDSLRGLQDSINDIIARDQLTQLAAAKQHSDYWMGVLYERARFSKYSKDTTLLVRTKQLYDALPAAEKSSVKGKRSRHIFTRR
ncbi:hypothetical protein MKQ70_35860 [Chitinophaga sedimenti]|uniref:hypothetical protein n=1 Tax=Chitinophaga sedimenti TaxID=2033606 RepID=UPI00200362F6|nr:hypothetical protein [Chitinophaga sedimenti]MCK7560012.1 hypothetical protein [Chitinophaga sedimenti]